MEVPADFTEMRVWPAVLDERLSVLSQPAVYALLHQEPFGRLSGTSRILYIGSTGQLGGPSESCRLRIYRYPNGPQAAELRRRVQILIERGIEITLHWKYFSSKEEALSVESRLLRDYEQEHHELPPFNGRKNAL